mmetsp:Transcript_98343/g.220159  ORF Transcript_98343/g.220159 Transcript_98343/m.220159 type:complete len:436 (+) Transcript_98343:75-1382(+)
MSILAEDVEGVGLLRDSGGTTAVPRAGAAAAAPAGPGLRQRLLRLAAAIALLMGAMLALALATGRHGFGAVVTEEPVASPPGAVRLFGVHLPVPHLRLPWHHPAAAPAVAPPELAPALIETTAEPVPGSSLSWPTTAAPLFACDSGYNESTWETNWTQDQMNWCCENQGIACPQPRKMVFYMYRAQSDADYPMINVNMADLPGVMWYLHNEVVVSTPRKYNVTRIVRWKVTMKTTQESYMIRQRQFGPFTAFDLGKCTVPNCPHVFEKFGYVVGCQNTDSTQGLGNYVSLTTIPCTPPDCKEGAWYSLPGPCPIKMIDSKDEYCNETMPGGECPSDDVTGTPGCTFYSTWAGEVRLDELVGISDYHEFWLTRQQEYNVNEDAGVCDPGFNCSFWNGRNDQEKCAWRMQQVEYLFAQKYYYQFEPTLAEPPPCDLS